MPSLNISLVAETVFHLGPGFAVTNSLLTTWLVMTFLVVVSFAVTRNLALVPGRVQSVAEIAVEGLYSLFEAVLHEQAGRYFSLLATFFVFIAMMNWTEILPGIGTIGVTLVEEGKKVFVPLFRPGTADLNTTLALAVIAFLVIQSAGLAVLRGSYIKKFLNFANPISFYVGILEIISELSRVVSFAFRLFGNIFAGDVLLTVIAFLMPLFGPLPFLGLELFVGFIQALVFSMLTAVFLSVAITHSDH
ncbi:F0F1 ATP synthase subunit A [Patescibacteria group bacterium]|nr:F0F1 ATP synthase subunit A [Patescibacteria group bacterium]